MPPDVRDWLPEGHLAWFVLDAVSGLDLREFYAVYRRDGVGRRAYDPAMVVALLLYSYARGVRSARKIERACEEDVAFRMIAMMERPDHATIARFVARHEAALAGLFGQVLGLCARAGLVRPGVVAVDGTRMAGNASRESTRDFGEIAREILAEAKRSMRPRMSSMAISAGMSCPSSCARARAAPSSFARRASSARARQQQPAAQAPDPGPVSDAEQDLSSMWSGSWRASKGARVGRGRRAVSLISVAGRTLIGFLARVRIGCCSPGSGWRPSVTVSRGQPGV